MDFWEEHGSHLLAPKMEPKIDIAMKAEKSKTCHSPLGPIRLRGIQLGSPRLTIEQKMKSTLEGILALALILHILGGFREPSWEAKSSQDATKKRHRK